jgi:preprotein translocase subunit SecA
MIASRIENAQKSVEAQNFDARKHLLEYDDVMNKQRETIYAIRRSALEGKDQRDYVLGIAEDVARETVDTYCPRELHPGQWNTAQYLAEMNSQFGIDAKAMDSDPTTLNHDQLAEATVDAVKNRYAEREKQFSPDLLRWLERRIILDVVDTQWKDHLLSLDHLKEGIGLRGYGQKDPLVEFKKEAFVLFEDMMTRIDNETVRYLFHVQIQQGEAQPQQARPAEPPPQQRAGLPSAQAAAASAAARMDDAPVQKLPDFARALERKQERQQKDLQFQAGAAQAGPQKPVRAGAKVGRNDPCPCGSGKKYKKCHGTSA